MECLECPGPVFNFKSIISGESRAFLWRLFCGARGRSLSREGEEEAVAPRDETMEREREMWAQAMSRRQGWFGDVHANQQPQHGWDAKPSERGRLEQDIQHVRDRVTELQGRNSNHSPRGGSGPRLGPVLEIPRLFLHRVLSSNLIGTPSALHQLYSVELRADLSAFDVRVVPAGAGNGGGGGGGGGGGEARPEDETTQRCIEVCLAEPVVSAHWTEISISAALPAPPTSVRESRARPPSRLALRGWNTKKVRSCVTYATMLDAEPAFLFFSQDSGRPTVLSVCGNDVRAVSCGEPTHSNSSAASSG
jgi:hypothetical protein